MEAAAKQKTSAMCARMAERGRNVRKRVRRRREVKREWEGRAVLRICLLKSTLFGGRAAVQFGLERKTSAGVYGRHSRISSISARAQTSATRITLPRFEESQLIKFIEDNGGTVPRGALSIKDKREEESPLSVGGAIVSGNRHFITLNEDADGATSVIVPRECWMEAKKDWRHASLVEAYINKGYENEFVACMQRSWVLLSIRLLDEICLCEESRFAPYLATLQFGDDELGSLPPCCAYLDEDFKKLSILEVGEDDSKCSGSGKQDEERTILNDMPGLQFSQTSIEYREFVMTIWNSLVDENNGFIGVNRDTFRDEYFNFTKFMWAFGVLRCRTFGPLQGDNIALVPLLDLAAHDPYAGFWQTKKGSFLGGKEGMELPLNFSASEIEGRRLVKMRFDSPDSPKTTSQMGLDYGVVEQISNRGQRSGYQLTLSLDEEDPNFDDKLDVLEMEGLGASVNFFLPTEIGSEPPENMLPYLRLMSLGGADAFLLESIFRDKVWSFMQQPVSEQNEKDMCCSMIEGSKEALSFLPKYDSSLSSYSDNVGSIIEVALTSEKYAILSILEWFERQSMVLDKLMYYQERRLRDLNLIDDEGKTTYDPFDDMTIA